MSVDRRIDIFLRNLPYLFSDYPSAAGTAWFIIACELYKNPDMISGVNNMKKYISILLIFLLAVSAVYGEKDITNSVKTALFKPGTLKGYSAEFTSMRGSLIFRGYPTIFLRILKKYLIMIQLLFQDR